MENETGESLQQQLHEELKAVEDLDPALPGMTAPHQHQAHRTTEVEKLTRHRQVCACGAHRDTGLTISGGWVGGRRPQPPGRGRTWGPCSGRWRDSRPCCKCSRAPSRTCTGRC